MRQAFQLFLSGDTSYSSIGARIGVQGTTVRSFMKNPIYCGWRVIDKKRDPSPGARRLKTGGRQGDRRKILRAPEDVIRVKVINSPLISESEFQQAQGIMTVKKARHWRTNPAYEHVYTYNGFLTCARCGDLIYTYRNRSDRRYYVCKNKQYPRDHRCNSEYMRRETLEEKLDALFVDQLSDRGFLLEIMRAAEKKLNGDGHEHTVARLQRQVDGLRRKRQRVLDTFFDGLITVDDRDVRLRRIEADLRLTQDALLRETPTQMGITTDALAKAVQPFACWDTLKREHKRRLLTSLIPEIKVVNYQIHGLYLTPQVAPSGRHPEGIRTDTGSSPPQA